MMWCDVITCTMRHEKTWDDTCSSQFACDSREDKDNKSTGTVAASSLPSWHRGVVPQGPALDLWDRPWIVICRNHGFHGWFWISICWPILTNVPKWSVVTFSNALATFEFLAAGQLSSTSSQIILAASASLIWLVLAAKYWLGMW